MDEQKLTPKEYLELAIEAGIGAIPIVGGPVQTMYFGRQNEKRFKRIEAFYTSLNEDLKQINSQIEKISDKEINRDQLIGIFETINEEVEKARSQFKINLYKNLYKNSILSINQTSWNEEEYFLEVLNRLTPLQISLISFFNPSDDFKGGITVEGFSQELVDGSLNILADLGILQSNISSLTFGGGIGKQKMGYKLSPLGRQFIAKTLIWFLFQVNRNTY